MKMARNNGTDIKTGNGIGLPEAAESLSRYSVDGVDVSLASSDPASGTAVFSTAPNATHSYAVTYVPLF